MLPILSSFTVQPLETLFFLIGLIIGVTVHEFAHAWVASRQGDQTSRMLGRVSLNPLAHLDPAGSLMFLLAGIGYGKPVPVNPYQLKDGRLGDFYVSIAGIVTNLITAFIFALPFRFVQLTGSDPALLNGFGFRFAAAVVFANCLLAAFNLLPIPPLDGSKAIGILVPRRFERPYQRYLEVGPVILIGLLLADLVFRVGIFSALIEPILYLFSSLTAGRLLL